MFDAGIPMKKNTNSGSRDLWRTPGGLSESVPAALSADSPKIADALATDRTKIGRALNRNRTKVYQRGLRDFAGRLHRNLRKR
jgi:hypothetical protein